MNFTKIKDEEYESIKMYIQVGTLLILSLAFHLLNLIALVAILKNKKNSSYFVMNIFLSSSVNQITALFVMLESYKFISTCGEWLCGLFNLWKTILRGVTPLTVVGLFYEKLKSSGFHFKRFDPVKVFLLTWGMAFLLACPSYFTKNMFAPLEGEAHCRKLLLFDSIVAQILYDIVLLLSLHVVPSIFILYYFRKIRFRLKYLRIIESFPTPLKEKLYQIQLVFCYSIGFVIVMLPGGFVQFFKQIAYIQEVFNPSNPLISTSIFQKIFLYVPRFMLLFFSFFHPMIYIWTHNQRVLSEIRKLCSYFRREEEASDQPDYPVISSAFQLYTIREESGQNSNC